MHALASAALVLALVMTWPAVAQRAAPSIASAWVVEPNVKLRLVADRGVDEAGRLMAGVEIELADGWKTYWRMPGTSGVPPGFAWKGSTNTASIDVQLPAPRRFRDPDGDTVGYKQRVLWPVLVVPAEWGKTVALKLKVEIGVCKDICIPVEANLSLELESAKTVSKASAVEDWLKLVPRPADKRRSGDPVFERIAAELTDPRPRLQVEASYPHGAEEADLFIEAPDGLWVPLPTIIPQAGNPKRVTFDFDLSKDVELKALRGRLLRLTAVGRTGASETTFKLE